MSAKKKASKKIDADQLVTEADDSPEPPQAPSVDNVDRCLQRLGLS